MFRFCRKGYIVKEQQYKKKSIKSKKGHEENINIITHGIVDAQRRYSKHKENRHLWINEVKTDKSIDTYKKPQLPAIMQIGQDKNIHHRGKHK